MKRYNYACLNALAHAFLTAAICIRLVVRLSYLSSSWSRNPIVLLDVVQVCAAVLCCLACLSLPRRPIVEEARNPVDGQYTVSAFGRYTFTWAGVTLILARKKKTLGLDDLPILHAEGRSAYRQEYFSTRKARDQLWKTLLFAHLPEILFQNVFTALQSVAQFIPQLVLYQLLKRLESRTKGASADMAAWGLVVALGLAIILSAWTQAWLHWIVWARLGQPIRTELSVLIFGKATRRKDVKGVQKTNRTTDVDVVNEINMATAGSETNDQDTAETYPTAGPNPSQGKTAPAEDASEDNIQKSRQSTINLVVRLVPPTHAYRIRWLNTRIDREWMQSVSQTLLPSII